MPKIVRLPRPLRTYTVVSCFSSLDFQSLNSYVFLVSGVRGGEVRPGHPYGRPHSQWTQPSSQIYPGSGVSRGYSMNIASSSSCLDQLSTSNIESQRTQPSQSQYSDVSANESLYQSSSTPFPSTPTQSSSHSTLTVPSSPLIRQPLMHQPPLQSSNVAQHERSDSPAGQLTTNNIVDGKPTGRGANFSDNSLKQLCKSWLQVSQDPVFGIDQKGSTFWACITADHNKRVSPSEIRTVKSLESRWASLNRSMARFAGYVEQIRGLRDTGKGPDDIVIDALALYKQEVGLDFKDVECYKILRVAPKWQVNPVY